MFSSWVSAVARMARRVLGPVHGRPSERAVLNISEEDASGKTNFTPSISVSLSLVIQDGVDAACEVVLLAR